MIIRCDFCGYLPELCPDDERMELHSCDHCGAVYCDECLEECATDYDMTADSQSAQAHFMRRHPDSGEVMCPVCYSGELECTATE